MRVVSASLMALALLSASGCSGQRTASLTTCAIAGAGVGVAAGAAYGGLEGGGFETRDAAVGGFIGAGGGAVVGALICALIPERSAAVEPPAPREPPVAPLPGTIDAPREIPPP